MLKFLFVFGKTPWL